MKTVPRIDGAVEVERVCGGDAGLRGGEAAGIELNAGIVEDLFEGRRLGVDPRARLAVGIGLRGVGETDVEGEAPIGREIGDGLEFVAAALAVERVVPRDGHIAEAAAVAAVGTEIADDVGVDECLQITETGGLRDGGIVLLRLVAAEGDVELWTEGDAEAVVLPLGDRGRWRAVVDRRFGEIGGVEGLREIRPDRNAAAEVEDAADGFGGFLRLRGRRVEIVLETVFGVLRERDARRRVARARGGRELRRAGRDTGGIFRDVGEFEIIGGRVWAVDEVVAREHAVARRMIERAEKEALAAVDLIGAERAEENQALLPEGNVGGGLVVFRGGVAEDRGVVAVGAENPERIVGARGAGRRIDESDGLHLGEFALALVPIVTVTQRLRARAADEAPGAGIGVEGNHVVFAGAEELLVFVSADEIGANIEPAGALGVGGGETQSLVGGVDLLALGAAEFVVGLEEVRVRGAVGEEAVDVDERILVALVGVVIDEAVAEELVNAAGELDVEGFAEALVDEHRGVAEAVNRGGIRSDVGERAARHAEGGAGNRRVVDAGRDHGRVDERSAVKAEVAAAGRGEAVDGAVAAEKRGLHHARVAKRGVEAAAGGGRDDPAIGADARGAEGGLARERGGLETRVNGPAVPAGEGVVEGVHARGDFLFVIVADERNAGGASGLDGERRGNAAALRAFPIAKRVGVLPGGDDARGDLVFQRVVGIDGGAEGIPRTILSADLGGVAAKTGAFHDGVGRATDGARAEEDRVGAARVVHAFEVVGRGIGTAGEKVAVDGIGADAANRAAASAAEELAAAIVRRGRRADGPVDGLVEIAQIEGVEEFAGLYGVGDGRVHEISGETSARERAGGDEADVLRRVHLEGRERDEGLSRGSRSGRGLSEGRGRVAEQADEEESNQTKVVHKGE